MGFYLIFAILLPLFILIWGSLLPYYKPPSAVGLSLVSLENYRELFESESLVPVIMNTIILGGVSSVTIMFLSVLSSWFIYRTDIRGRKVLDFIVFLPYAVSRLAVGVAFMIVSLSFPNPIIIPSG